MPSTYISLCNQVLRRLNEVEVAEGAFDSVTGVQALVKDAVKAAVAKINQAEFEWPFNAAEETDTLVVGQEEYSWPSFYKIADFNSFQIQEDTDLGVSFTTLKHIDRDEWYKNHRDADHSSGTTGRTVPRFIFATHGNGYGVSPSPDKAYTLKFRYYQNYSDITAADDVTRIPDSYDTVLVDGALYHLYMFKDNLEASQASFIAFEKGIKDLQTLYINNYEYIRDTRIHRQSAPFFIDKMPNNFRHIGLIQLILPNAKIIDARRHPMACCFSGFKQLFASGQEFSYSLTDIGRYYQDYMRLMNHWHEVLPGKVLTVHHEAVVFNLEQQVRRILDFCALEFDPACLNFHQTERSVRTPSSEQVRQPIYQSGLEAWMNFEPWLEPLKAAIGDEILTGYPDFTPSI